MPSIHCPLRVTRLVHMCDSAHSHMWHHSWLQSLMPSHHCLIQPIADRVAQHLEIISKNLQFHTRRTRILMGFINYYLVLIVNPMGRMLVRWKSFRNNLEMLCHPICNWLYMTQLYTFTYMKHILTTVTHAFTPFCDMPPSHVLHDSFTYWGVAKISRPLKIIGLFCKRAL